MAARSTSPDSSVPAVPSPALLSRVERLARSRVTGYGSVSGGCTAASRCIVRFEDGRTAFLKAATDAATGAWLRSEHRVYAALRTGFLPGLLGWDDDAERPLMLLEDLSMASWPPPWTAARIDQVLAALAEVHATAPLESLPRLREEHHVLAGWSRVAEDPRPFLSLQICSPEWLQAALPSLLKAQDAADLDGTALLHCDVRSDNLCFRAGRAVLIDWNHASIGNPRADVLAWLPSLHAEGGPSPDSLMPGEPEIVALLAGYWASRAGLPDPFPGSTVRQVQLKQLRVALPWAARVLELPAPTGSA